jgi:Xaa-Pro aminopeptidase
MWTGHVRYFSNFPPPNNYYYVVFPKEGNPTQFVFTKNQEQVASRGWIRDSRQTSNYPDALVNRIKELDYKGKRIGLVGAENISFKIYEHLKKELPSATFIDATKEIFNLRMIKSDEEQALVRECAHIADRLFSRVKEVAKAGVSESDIYAEMNYFMWKQGVESAFNPIGSGRFPISMFLSPSNRVLGLEDSLLLELTPRFQGYYAQLTVVHPLQDPSPRMREFLDIAFSAQKAGLNLLRPGNRAGDVARAMKDVVEKSGYTFPYRGGHSMGHDLNEPPAIVVEDDTILSSGMTIVVHPSVMDKNGEGVFIGDSYLITNTGWERLNSSFSMQEK